MTAPGARVVFLIRVPEDRQRDFLDAYEKIRFLVAGGVPGHIRDQVCQSATDPEQWLITSEWRAITDFEVWEKSQDHRDLVKPMRDCFTEARSLRFHIRTSTASDRPAVSHASPVPSTSREGEDL
ncbi:antibiotic biosynthesis monooxygenase [Streptomyces filamentosus]|uniref:Antibiotic biosynthesis monooxygenase n=2 Tax=Streptomyces filamentosus TaxID=67294 RepID=A0ABY4UXY5_STRFL|nr:MULTISPECIES: antibiotic biosynthesis monooxygenase family protein [Streptomyces]MYR80287.1 antibiotic biosynthesis monooxygenase [Streptomyces sp. SID5466]NUV67215.1 antibiotic biosynthesis monooxygenase [Streptomyces sp. CAI-121]NUW03633.1 antibiotic biosynthesis monooxygenase [Streptomyces sp. CAI 127]NUW13333.1 antibiotic biosynthesis monooxygenase [Streptomyces sp. CAI-68]EFE76299.1 antibiotic biosynthesis monooxygenase [Streptomyces filamentosus NRRL 15998]